MMTSNTAPMQIRGHVSDLAEPDSEVPLHRMDTLRERNGQRAAFAGVAVKAYAAEVGLDQPGEDVETAISDMLGDLHHLCDALSLSLDALLARGKRHYDEEIVADGY